MYKLLLLSYLLCEGFIVLQAEYPYCFRFTWIGPFQAKNMIDDLTCDQLRGDSKTIPCRKPLVVTDNDKAPDTADIWHANKDNPEAFACPMHSGQMCVKYSYFYNKAVQNITYMCAKVNTTAGCYNQKFISGAAVEVCVCESKSDMMPCNYAYPVYGTGERQWSTMLMCLVIAKIIYRIFNIS
ncbi:uncharacterized protein LOC119683002 [Teleopsis dalmanni]|uniref:uncharacterized protein LOC119683002 n=1 Tax=Teleopsis dalmanni TaxID=139649 RepID=UPI0018CD1762|nr:uncharacterized protein LOC119683002 [Teleopsis dalmanni]